MRVTINAGGQEVTIETSDANVTPEKIASEALAVWRETAGADKGAGPAVGFVPQVAVAPTGYANLRREQPRVTS